MNQIKKKLAKIQIINSYNEFNSTFLFNLESDYFIVKGDNCSQVYLLAKKNNLPLNLPKQLNSKRVRPSLLC